ncbi:unnamed protein product, partial [marine sediment metagenome]
DALLIARASKRGDSGVACYRGKDFKKVRLLVRIVGRVLRVLSKLRAKRASRAISKFELLECLSGYESVEDFLHDFRSRKEPSFSLRKENLPLLGEVLPQSEEAIIRDADEICAHNFDLLG